MQTAVNTVQAAEMTSNDVCAVLTRRRAAPNVTDNTDESERVGQLSALWNTGVISRLLSESASIDIIIRISTIVLYQ